MTIYEFEDKIYFDGAISAGIAELEDTSEQKMENTNVSENNSDPGNSENFENLLIAPEMPLSESSDEAVDSDSDASTDNYQSNFDDIATILDNIDATIADDFLDNQNFLIISSDNKNFEGIADSLNDNTTLIVYDSDDSFDSIIEQLKVELGDNKAVNIGILDSNGDQPALRSSDEVGLSVISEQLTNNQQLTTDNQISDFFNDLKDLQFYDGEINILETENDTGSNRLVIIKNQLLINYNDFWIAAEDAITISDYFDSDSSFITTCNE